MLSFGYQMAQKIIHFCHFSGSRAGKNSLRIIFSYSHTTRSKWLLPYLVRFSINIIYVSWCFLLNPYFYE